MDLPWGDERSIQFITNVGLVTSNGPHGHNIMACEGTHHLSYRPGIIAVNIGHHKATYENIMKTKEFGVSIAATDQNILSSIAGGNSGKTVDKIAVLKELGYEFMPAKKIKILMVKNAVLHIECKLIQSVPVGDHMLFIGEVVEATLNPGKEPLAYHKSKYWKMDNMIPKPSETELAKIKKAVEKHTKNALKHQ